MIQMSLFDGEQPFKITKPIRLITLFSGYDSQALALKYLGVPFEHYRTCEWAVPSIQGLKDLHFGEDDTDYSAGLTKDDVCEHLYERGISSNYNEPMSKAQIWRLGEMKARRIYNNIKASHNLVSITKATGEELGIVDKDKYTYILTCSFPCQDLSLAGRMTGMGRESGTRSSMLWQVERLLNECHRVGQLPDVLLMENVPQVVGKKNIAAFSEWLSTLDGLGYKSKWKIINATDFGVPQNRERCFMVSVLGDYYYDFPTPIGCTLRLKDVLEHDVPKCYDLKEGTIIKLNEHKARHDAQGNGFGWKPIDVENAGGGGTLTALIPRAEQDPMETLLLSKQTLPPPWSYIDAYNHRIVNTGVCGTITCRGNTSTTACGTFLVIEPTDI